MENDVFRQMKVRPGGTDTAGPSYRRLRRKLVGWAESLGYSRQPEASPTARRPEVVRTDGSGRFLFFGDVLDATATSSSVPYAVERFVVAASEFGGLLLDGSITGGKLALILNDEAAAADCARQLGESLSRQGLVGEDQQPPAFRVKQLAPSTWVAYW